jgi:Na+/H+ antiporter NhaD/arsenite permease-like protein
MIAALSSVASLGSLVAVAGAAEGEPLGARLPVLSLAPFALILLCIAVMPLAAPHWWESNRNKGIVSGLLSLPFAAWLVLTYGAAGAHEINHAVLDYLSFMALLGSLFVISGGIVVRGSLAGTPLSNSVFLAIGAVLANLIGTTGASMVLLRPLLRANAERYRKVHVVIFFIFVVSNCGGLLTPLGDPPLFLGFLKGVPFDWTLRLWKEWLLVNGLLIVLFNIVDQMVLTREEREHPGEPLLEEVSEHQPLRIAGWHNFLFLAGVVLIIVGKGQEWGTSPDPWPFGMQEGMMLALAFAAHVATRDGLRAENRFTFAPIVEVAVLFAGIFVTMVAPLMVLNARGASLGIESPLAYFWAAGMLSSFLDNAPTYLTFAATAAGQLGVSVEDPSYLAAFLAKGELAERLLTAISCGAVFMGANTYIGNGPNFMVKAIAEENGVKMPSFFGYMAWSCAILIPIFGIVSLVFFRG